MNFVNRSRYSLVELAQSWELNMKRLAFSVTAVAAFVGQALAADMPVKAVRPAPVMAAVSWTGCYVGGGGGYGLWDQENTQYFDIGPRTRVSETTDTGGRGWFGTVQGGCDYQFGMGAQQFVIGAQADYDFADIRGNHATSGPQALQFVARETLTDQWAVGGRIGWLAFPSLLTYFSAGYTEARFGRQDYTFLFGPPFGVPGGIYTPDRWYKGWYIGAGDEYALSFLPGLFWKTEYRFSRMDSVTNPSYFTGFNPPLLTGFSEDSRKYIHTVRSELVYRFNWGGPVVAKY
jgi:outer membrane immunogenic protein